ncbi:hypothetical protein N0V93_008417 [Gnomoniopsis smithogilvyi]|uniref:BTB domain-containing protein n=1 Tax=Gnomoniopsis smithogilvyi TaxID=1191159 RepID=A0A9W9CUV2_9PEZI|nr:hypothetical protein N0V93_008417 [Gnomoniopsis smithogilvyi]
MANTDAKVMTTEVSFSSELFESGWLADVEIQCGEQSYKAHKLILCGQSKWFRSALMGDFQEAKTGVINITDFEAVEVLVLLKFLYTGSVDITPEFCDKSDNPFIQQMRLFHLANHFKVIRLQDLVYKARDDHAIALSKQLCQLSAEQGQIGAAAEQVVTAMEEHYDKYRRPGVYAESGVKNAFGATIRRLVMCNVQAMVQSPRFMVLLKTYPRFAARWARLLTGMVCERGSFQPGEVVDLHCARCDRVADFQSAVLDPVQWNWQGKMCALCGDCFEWAHFTNLKESEPSVG